jgi:translation elongation factor EF-Tu-like GTPase
MGFFHRHSGKDDGEASGPIMGQQTGSVTYQVPVTVAGGFMMVVEDVFTITGRGTVATGRIRSGSVSAHDEVKIFHPGDASGAITSEVIGIEMFHKVSQAAKAGDNVGLMLKGVERNQIERDCVITKGDADIESSTVTKQYTMES